MKIVRPLLPVFLFALAFVIAPGVHADGIFVVPKFVWDKHKDINEPTQKAIIVYDQGHEDLILQVKYEGPVDQFGWLIPVPNLPAVKQGSMKCFYELSKFTQERMEGPRLVEAHRPWHIFNGVMEASDGAVAPPVNVVEIETIGSYDIAVLSANDSSALKEWLDDHHFYLPLNKFDVINGYIQNHWYFVAVKINLDESASRLQSASAELASGELNPLHINFASERCVFPLKISSINSTASEVQLYVLSPEPILEKGMLERRLAEPDRVRFNFLTGQPEDPLPYLKTIRSDLPECNKRIHQFGNKSWWLTKQTWTFRPEEMRDLVFEPAVNVLGDMLGSQYGAFAAENLAKLGSNAVPVLIAAMQSKNPVVRSNTASVFLPADQRLAEAALAWLKSPDSLVRGAGINAIVAYGDLSPRFISPVVARLGDNDADVRELAVAGLRQLPDKRDELIPHLEPVLKDTDPDVRIAGLKVAAAYSSINTNFGRLVVAMLRDQNASVRQAAISDCQQLSGGAAEYSPLFGQILSDRGPQLRIAGIEAISGNWQPASTVFASASMIVPLLHDPDEGVRKAALIGMRKYDGSKKCIPVFQEMLKDKDPSIRAAALAMLQHTDATIPEDTLFSFFTSPDPKAQYRALWQLLIQRDKISDDDAAGFLQSPAPEARLLGLEVLVQNWEKQSVDLALPLLRDPDKTVRQDAWETLRALTGQSFTDRQVGQWTKWWNEKRATFVVSFHPAALP